MFCVAMSPDFQQYSQPSFTRDDNILSFGRLRAVLLATCAAFALLYGDNNLYCSSVILIALSELPCMSI